MSSKKPEPEKDENGTRIITQKFVCKLCEYNGGYISPEYNYTCYLHFFAFRKIQNLDSFINLRVLYLENNSIEKIENLDKLNHLESLYLQNNYIINIENLDNNKELVNINLSSNKIKKIQNIVHLEKLENLYLGKNPISCPDDIEEVTKCKNISLLDIQNCQVSENPDGMLEILSRIKGLKVLYFRGNDITRKMPNYRKTLIVKLEKLTYLDDRPIKEEDRIGAVAFSTGGFKSESQARREYIEQNDKVIKIRENEKELMKVPFEERKHIALESLYNECKMRKEKIENQKRVLREKYLNLPNKWEDLELQLISLNYQLFENERYKEQEEKIITLTISKRENLDQDINVFIYEKWMDEIIEVEVVENFFNFENALKRIQKEFEKKKVKNFHLFNVLDLRSKWTEIEINKYTDNNGINFYELSKEDIFSKEELNKIFNSNTKTEENLIKPQRIIEVTHKKEEVINTSIPPKVTKSCDLEELD